MFRSVVLEVRGLLPFVRTMYSGFSRHIGPTTADSSARRRRRRGPQSDVAGSTVCWPHSIKSRHPTAQRENENLESNWRKVTRHGKPGAEVGNPQGLKVLGTLDHEAAAQERSGNEEEFWRTIEWVPDLQCAWQLLVRVQGRNVTTPKWSLHLFG